MRYQETFLQQIKASLPVSAVIGARIAIRRHGREFMALCPFHKEKTPSFTINDDKGFYHCFGCGAHGDVIGFVKEYEGISYKDAIERLAGEAGLSLPKPDPEAERKDCKRRNLQEICEMACRWFEAELASTQGFAARAYLSGRGIKSETISQFRLGYAPDDKQSLRRFLEQEGVTVPEMIAAGLLISVDGREAYARFRGRVIFPIRNARGQVVAFGGRLLGQNVSGPKYLNSPETELFYKGQQLYNLDLARRPAQDAGELLLCEGYMDVIALAQAGLKQAVAPLGTAITEMQLRQCWQLVDMPLVCLDGDAAGERAMWRAAELALPLLKPGKSLAFMSLPAGDDPDSLLRRAGVAAFRAHITQARPLADALCQHVLEQPASTPEQAAAQEQALYAYADRIADASVKTHYREHIRRQLWQRRSASPRYVAPKRAGAAPAKHDQSNLDSLSISRHTRLPGADMSEPRTQAVLFSFALMLSWPELMQKPESDWFLNDLSIEDAGLSQLQMRLSQSVAAPQMIDTTQMLAPLASPMQAALQKHLQRLRQAKAEDAQEKGRLWRLAMTDYRHACLKEEQQQASREMAAEMQESLWQRFSAIQQELEQVEQEQRLLQQERLFAE